MNYKVSIIVPCYNQAQYLPEALQSVLFQTYSNWECIIINDGSPDNTEEVVHEWIKKDERFRYVKKDNGGLSSARNAGLDLANGNYIQFLDADDCLSEKKIEISIERLSFNKNKDYKMVISNFEMFSNNIGLTSNPYCELKFELFNFNSILYGWDDTFTIPIHCGFFDYSLFLNFRFPIDLRAKEDWVMWGNLFLLTEKVIFVDEVLAFYRMNPNSMTRKENLFPDFLKAVECFSTLITPEEYNKFTIALISRQYNIILDYKKKIAQCKLSNTYKLGYLLKKLALKSGLLTIWKVLFERVIKIKFISKRLHS